MSPSRFGVIACLRQPYAAVTQSIRKQSKRDGANEDELLQQEWRELCYPAAMRWITVAKEPDWVVVHGMVSIGKPGQRIDHAWCERDGVVVDLTMPAGSRRIARERYYQSLQPQSMTVYSFKDAVVLSAKTGHQGPWDESEQVHE